MNPVFYLFLAVIPLAALARWRRAYPSKRLVTLALAPAGASFVLLLWSGLWPIVLTVDLAVLIAVIADLTTVPSADSFVIERHALRIAWLAVGQDNEFERLRDYSRDDVFKHIHWRTTARRNKLTVKD